MNEFQIRNLPFLSSNGIKSGEMEAPSDVQKSDGAKFTDFLKESIKDVNSTQVEADKAVEGLVSGKTDNLHETMIALEKADVSFRLMMQVRNKIVDAYQEIMRTHV